MRVDLSYLRFRPREFIQAEDLGELLLGKSLFRVHDSGSLRTFIALSRIEQDKLFDLPQFVEHLFHG